MKNKKEAYYSDYLQLDKILSAQELRSKVLKEPIHDELLFIISHQAYELWFKQIIHEIDSIINLFKESYIDFSSIAKGFAVDLIADFLLKKSITNFFIEIGGEIRAGGKNFNNESWVIGIERPKDGENKKLLAKVPIDNLSIATSGNYRNYYFNNDTIIFHTIDTKTGYPSYSDMITIRIKGVSSHAARPEEGENPLPILSQIYQHYN